MNNLNKFIDSIEKSVEEEIDFIWKSHQEATLLSSAELRKAGLRVFPCKINKDTAKSDARFVSLETSFSINTSYFKRGVNVLLKTDTNELKARIYDLSDNLMTLKISEEADLDLFDKTIQVDYLPDDRTLDCMRFGVKFFNEQSKLHDFYNDLLKPSENVLFVDSRLNESQQKALGSILSTGLTTLIQGPPGTGKTHTLAVAILELIKLKKRVIISAPSNTAVDNLCLKVISLSDGSPINLLRVGNDEKINNSLSAYTTLEKLESSKKNEVLKNLNKQLIKAQQVADRFVRNFSAENAQEKREARQEVKQLRKEIRAYTRAAESELIESSSIIAGTPVALFNTLSKDFSSDVLIIDEAGQALTPLIWLIAGFGNKLVLCGDPQQLPPVVLSQKAKSMGLGESLLEYCCQQVKPILLTQQYRIPGNVLTYCNRFFYEGKLTSTVENSGFIRFIDMAGYGEGEQTNPETGSISNWSEVLIIQQLINQEGINPENTAVLAPYSAQISLLQNQLGHLWHVSTIDSVQGQEKDNIIISLTRSNEEGTIGFLSDYRRTNVAITRTKKRCYVVGDSSTLGNDPFYNGLIEHMESTESYTSAWEFGV